MYKIISFLFILILFFASATKTFAASIKIMPLGDSITYGVGDTVHAQSGYRWDLYSKLATKGVAFDFVGAQKSGTVADRDNEGHPGWTIENILGIVDNRMSIYKPDVVLLMIGTNNLRFQSSNVENAKTKVTLLINKITTDVPNASVFVASIPPINNNVSSNRQLSPLTASKVIPYNQSLPGIVEQFKSQGKKVYFVDIYSVFTLQTDFADALHPNALGYSKEASKWFESLNNSGVLIQ